MVVPIAGGGTARVPLSKNGVPMTSEDGIEITAAGITINPDKKPVYTLGFKDTRHRVLRQVRVEDVSDDAAIALVDDKEPKSSAAGEWSANTDPMGATDRRLKWLETVSNSTRVFRFTLTFADGRTQTLLQGMQIGAPTKAALRGILGLNY